jgi:hypothetical protein
VSAIVLVFMRVIVRAYIIGRSERAGREAFQSLERTAREMGLRVNEGKTKYMEVITRLTNRKVRKVKNYEFECVNEFK